MAPNQKTNSPGKRSVSPAVPASAIPGLAAACVGMDPLECLATVAAAALRFHVPPVPAAATSASASASAAASASTVASASSPPVLDAFNSVLGKKPHWPPGEGKVDEWPVREAENPEERGEGEEEGEEGEDEGLLAAPASSPVVAAAAAAADAAEDSEEELFVPWGDYVFDEGRETPALSPALSPAPAPAPAAAVPSGAGASASASVSAGSSPADPSTRLPPASLLAAGLAAYFAAERSAPITLDGFNSAANKMPHWPPGKGKVDILEVGGRRRRREASAEGASAGPSTSAAADADPMEVDADADADSEEELFPPAKKRPKRS